MFNKKLIFTFIFLLSFAAPQLDASQIDQKLHSGTPNTTQSQRPLVGEKSESKIIPEYFKFKQRQTRTLEQLPIELKYIIGQFVGFDQAVNKSCSFDPFRYAICKHDSDAVQILVALQANLHNKKCQYEHAKSTPLHAAIQEYSFACNHVNTGLRCGEKEQKDTLAIVDYLLRKKIGINKPAEYKNTPMHQAVDSKLIDITQRLITAGADLSVKNRLDETPLDTARKEAMRPINPKYRKKAYAICNVLEQAGAPSSVMLQPMPTDSVMEQECIIASRRAERESGRFFISDRF
jgi:hypothetical protein